MKKNIILLTAFVFVLFANTSYSLTVIPNMPWDSGFGVDNYAGSGRHLGTPKTNIYKVTNLNDSGPGSLRDALVNQLSPKVIIFEVSGNIALQSPIKLGGVFGAEGETKGSYITIAGQTAPSPGITIKDYGIGIDRNCHDILIQHIRIRPGDTSFYDIGCDEDPPRVDCVKGGIADPMGLSDKYDTGKGWVPTHNIVIDHCSFSWGGDMNFQTGTNNLTFSNNIISEGLNSPLHPKGQHSKGLAIFAQNSGTTGCHNVAVLQNLLAYNVDRNPLVDSGKVVVANNYIQGVKWGIRVDDHEDGEGFVQVSIAGNYIVEATTPMYFCLGVESESRIFVAGDNYFRGQVRTDPWNDGISDIEERLHFGKPDSDIPEWAKVSSPPVWPEGYTIMSALDVKNFIFSHAGAQPIDRDQVDERVINKVKSGIGVSGIIESQADVGGWPNLAQNTRILIIPSKPNEVQASGYTKLEEWLHGFSRSVEGESSISPRTLKLQ